jgi:cellulose binding protein with CBM2 domain
MRRRITMFLSAVTVALVASTIVGTGPAASAAPAGAARPAAAPAAAMPAAVPAGAVQPATSPTADAYCRVTFQVFSVWATGYVAGIVVQNVSQVPVRWRLVVTFLTPLLGLQVWNGTATLTGSVLTIVPYPGSDILQPGQSSMVAAFTATGSPATPPQPQVTCTPV